MGTLATDLALDPSEVSVGRTALLLNSATTGLRVSEEGIDWGEAVVAPYSADLDVGSVPVDSRLANRTIRIPLSVMSTGSIAFDAAMLALRAKVGQIQQAGRGWFKRQAGLYADVVGASLTIPDVYGQSQGAEPNVVLSLEVLPDFYGDELRLDVASGTGIIAGVLQDIVNYCPNPNFEAETIGTAPASWVATQAIFLAAGATLTVQATAGGAAGSSKAMRVVTTAVTDEGAAVSLGVLPAGTYSCSAYVKGAGGELLTLFAGAASPGSTVDFAATSSYVRQSVTFTSDGVLPSYIGVSTRAASAYTFYVDAVQVTAGPDLLTYRDGSSAGNTWAGVANQSLSYRPAVVEGDYPGRCRIQVTENAAQNQKGLFGGLRRRNYSSAASAALAYESGLMTPINGAAAAALTGASGGSAVTLALPLADTWIPTLVTNLTSGNAPLTHKGSYRVWARVYSATARPQIRFVWGVGSLSVPIENDPVQLPAPAGFYLVDLGEIRLDAAPYGTHQWFGVFQGRVAAAADPLSIDEVFFQPLDEAAFSFAAVDQPSPSVVASPVVYPATGADNSGTGTGVWARPEKVSSHVDNTIYDWAQVDLTGAGTTTHYLVATNFGFALPSTATVVGVLFFFRLSVPQWGGWSDNRVRLVKGGSIQTTEMKSTLTWGYPDWRSYGGPTSMWGTTLLYSDVNASTFGLAYSLAHDAPTTDPAFVQFVGCQVYYTLGTGFSVAPDAVLYASKLGEVRTEGAWRNDAGNIPGPMGTARGQNPRIPPSGIEGSPVELFLKNSRGNLDQQPDAGLDSMTAQVIYRPSYLHRG